MRSRAKSSIVCVANRSAKSWIAWSGTASKKTRTCDMSDDLSELYQQVILDHSRSPRNFRKMDAANRTAQGHNPLCGDNVSMYLLMDGEVGKDVSFQGYGSAITKSSASHHNRAITGKSQAEE